MDGLDGCDKRVVLCLTKFSPVAMIWDWGGWCDLSVYKGVGA